MRGGCERVSTFPACIQVWARDERSVELMRGLKYGVVSPTPHNSLKFSPLTPVIPQGFAGAPLATALGTQLVNKGVRLNAGYGTTEIGFVIMGPGDLGRSEEEWMYLEFPRVLELRVVEVPGTGFVEIHLLVSRSLLHVWVG